MLGKARWGKQTGVGDQFSSDSYVGFQCVILLVHLKLCEFPKYSHIEVLIAKHSGEVIYVLFLLLTHNRVRVVCVKSKWSFEKITSMFKGKKRIITGQLGRVNGHAKTIHNNKKKYL